ncbi:MAG: MiaB/RimO family radical SAM methylthiotransferase [Candidatus Woesebacteria bacterium]|nr:MiaB/RimO family radical SAM methylthiotransferase [Candidatus Woesebacteria bacterium]
MKYFLKTYGCQYNVWDSVRIKYLLDHIGWQETSESESEVVFVIACAVRKSAVDRMLGKIHTWYDKRVVVTGCVLDDDKKKLDKKNVLYWDIKKPEKLKKILFEEYSDENFSLNSKSIDIEQLLELGNPKSAYLPIMTGCNNFCTYCAVPFTRGRETSRPMEEIIDDFKKLVAKGHKEIILLGQNVNSYNPTVISTSPEPPAGWTEGEEKSHDKLNNVKPFAMLLNELNNISGDFLISFTSNHPKDMTDDIIKAVRDLSKIKKEIHLPLQSGSNKVLRSMNRPYTKEQYLALIDKIRKNIPAVKITTDIIVGFPNETKEDFQETIDLFNKVNFTQAYINKYSPRVGTAAEKLGDPIPWSEKQRRWRILNDMQKN